MLCTHGSVWLIILTKRDQLQAHRLPIVPSLSLRHRRCPCQASGIYVPHFQTRKRCGSKVSRSHMIVSSLSSCVGEPQHRYGISSELDTSTVGLYCLAVTAALQLQYCRKHALKNWQNSLIRNTGMGDAAH